MRIMLDFDSVTADLDLSLRNSCNGRYGTNYQNEDITSWSWWNDRPDGQGDYVWGEECFLSREWTLSIPPVAGAIGGIEELIDEGHELTLVSDRSSHMKEWLETWLDNHGLSLPVYVTNRHNGPTKLDVIRELGLQIVIEDAPHHALEMSTSGLVDGVFLLDKPWNQGIANARVGRCFSWEHVVDAISFLEFAWGAEMREVFRG